MKEINNSIKKEELLIDYLTSYIGYSKSKAKSLLKYENISVNNRIVKVGNTLLHIGDNIKISNEIKVKTRLDIIYEDEDFLVINKKSGILTETDSYKEKSLYQEAKHYLYEKKKHEKLFVLHRIDKDTSGVVIFCKDSKLTDTLQDNWNDLVKSRVYLGIVDGILDRKEGTLRFFLKEGKNTMTLVTDKEHGKEAITKYKVLKENKDFSLLEIELLTGRKNQIRATLSHIGHPISGDKKYYSRTNIVKHLALQHIKIELYHPYKKKIMTFEIPKNKEFLKNFK